MRKALRCSFYLFAVLPTLVAACDTVPVDAGVFWQGRGDAGLRPEAATGSGAGGNVSDPGGGGGMGSGGMGVGGGSASGGARGTGGLTGSAGASGSGGMSGSSGSAGTSGTGGGSGTGVLTGTLAVAVTTKAPGGQYAPDNVGAIWIADSGTKFVKSLYVWGQQRRRELTRWTAATAAAGLPNNLVDAVSAATMSSHGARMTTWNGTNTSRALVPDGSYKVCFELEDGSAQYQCVDFVKGRVAQTLMPADTTSFTRRTIGYTP